MAEPAPLDAPPETEPPTLPFRWAVRAIRGRTRTRSFLSWTWFRHDRQEAWPLPVPAPTPLEPGVSCIDLAAPSGTGANRLALAIGAEPGERFVGFGERFHAVCQRGHRLETWTEEGGIGFGETLSPLLSRLGVSWNPFPKGPTTAYKPLPWFISSRGYGLLLDTHSPVFFDVCRTNPDVLRAEVLAPQVRVYVFRGDPATVLRRMTARLGRAPGLPDWALAPWNDAIGGDAELARVADLLRDRGIPSGAIWTEDWQGGQWSVPWLGRSSPYDIFPVYRQPSARLYPDLEARIRDLHERGFRFLTYFYPYVAASDPDYPAAAAAGYFVRNRSGRPATVRMLWHRTGQVDLQNPAARDWYRGYLVRALQLGVDGWMADFGEYTPPDAVTLEGERGLDHRNRYPGLWAALNRDAIREAGREGDAVFFSRSASLGQQAISPLFWSGDSNTDFERWDGLPSNLRGLLSAGLSGLSIWAADAGGYTCLWTRPRDAETLARWVELSAFLAVMRTHHSTHPGRSVQLDHTEETLEHYATYAKVHAALFPLLRHLVDEATRSGLPVARALLLGFPEDPQAWEVEDQFLLGDALLVAPVLERGARRRGVWLPGSARWVDLWSGRESGGGQRVQVEAPLGVCPLFLRADRLLPTFDRLVDTFDRRARVKEPELRTLDDAERSLAITLGPRWEGPETLYDGTRLAWASPGEALPALEERAPEEHALLPATLAGVWRVAACGEGESGTLQVDGRTLSFASPIPRRFTVYLPDAPGSAGTG